MVEHTDNVNLSPDGHGSGSAAKERLGTRIHRKIFAGNRFHKVLIVILAVLAVVQYGYKVISDQSLADKAAEEQQAVVDGCQRALAAQVEELLRVTTVSLAWATNVGLTHGDQLGVTQEITRLVREKYVTSIAVVDENGLVVTSTNKKWEGMPADNVPGATPVTSELVVRRVDDDFVVVAPMLSHEEQRLGAVVLAYSAATVKDRLVNFARVTK